MSLRHPLGLKTKMVKMLSPQTNSDIIMTSYIEHVHSRRNVSVQVGDSVTCMIIY